MHVKTTEIVLLLAFISLANAATIYVTEFTLREANYSAPAFSVALEQFILSLTDKAFNITAALLPAPEGS